MRIDENSAKLYGSENNIEIDSQFEIVDFDLKWIDFYIYERNPILGNLRMFQPADFPTLNPYPWILEKNPKRGTVTERVLRKKNPERSIASFCICSHVLEFFSGKRARWRSQKMAYIFVQHGIFPHTLAYAI